MSKIHVWIGMFRGTEEEFNAYFEVDRLRVKLGVGGSQFDRDIGLNWYDEDHIGVYHSTVNDSLRTVVDEVIGAPDTLDEIYHDCIEKGLVDANAMIYYFNDDIEEVSSASLTNGLVYIGIYEV